MWTACKERGGLCNFAEIVCFIACFAKQYDIFELGNIGVDWPCAVCRAERTLRRRRQELGWPVAGLLLEARTRAPAPVYCERSTRLFCLGIEKGKPKKS